MPTIPSLLRPLRVLLLCGAAAVALGACSTTNRVATATTDFSALSRGEAQMTLADLSATYKKRPRDKGVVLAYSSALRSEGQAAQAAAVLEDGMAAFPQDLDVRIAYAKALTAAGRFEQALAVLDSTIDPTAPNWNALSVKGAVLDQIGRNQEARAVYAQALLVAPQEASLEANLGLSYAMTNELDAAERHLRKAVTMRGASSQIRQNLALVVGLQGRFDESRTLFSAELAPDQVEANMSYIRSLLTQQNRWNTIRDSEQG